MRLPSRTRRCINGIHFRVSVVLVRHSIFQLIQRPTVSLYKCFEKSSNGFHTLVPASGVRLKLQAALGAKSSLGYRAKPPEY